MSPLERSRVPGSRCVVRRHGWCVKESTCAALTRVTNSGPTFCVTVLRTKQFAQQKRGGHNALLHYASQAGYKSFC